MFEIALASHEGGCAAWCADGTDAMENSNLIVLAVDNSIIDRIYPRNADCGGLYRDVNLLCVSQSRFEPEYRVRITPIVDGNDANVEVEVWIRNPIHLCKAGRAI